MTALSCRAILFDLDGVLVDSRRCIELVWHTWAARRSLDPEPFLRVAHGRRTSETLRLVAPDLDAVEEVAALDALEEAETRGLIPAPGAAALLDQLEEGEWAVVTSGTRNVATLRLTTAGLRIPRVLVTADHVEHGKPDPEGYLYAASSLGVLPSDCVVIEDSPTGLAAAKAGGIRALAVLTTHGPDALADADARLPSLAGLRLREPVPPETGLIVEF